MNLAIAPAANVKLTPPSNSTEPPAGIVIDLLLSTLSGDLGLLDAFEELLRWVRDSFRSNRRLDFHHDPHQLIQSRLVLNPGIYLSFIDNVKKFSIFIHYVY
jgi:hypothetical protein